jgi:arylsulfatase A
MVNKMKFRMLLEQIIGAICSILVLVTIHSCKRDNKLSKQPNIVIVLADDMGYGDLQCYNPESGVPTPNINKMASEGMMFTDAHTTSSVCTPSRFGLVTGKYSWRGVLKKGVTWSYDSCIISKDEVTIGKVLQQAGYSTACIGKWHLGLGWQKLGDSVLFDQPLSTAPTDLGFDYFYGLTASLDIPPYVYIENNKVAMQPTGFSEGPSPVIQGAFWRNGPVSPDFDHYKTLEHLTDKAIEYIYNTGDKPFLLYFPLTAPHLPWIPSDDFKGKSTVGDYGDLMAEVDNTLGQVMQALKNKGIDNNTMVIFTSDNGSQLSSENMTKYKHKANGDWRGRKGDIFEGGHRVPFIVRWPGKVQAGTKSNQLVSMTDLLKTCADVAGIEATAKDSKSFYPVLFGNESNELRTSMIYHSALGLFALRDGDYVFVEGKGTGGFLEVPDTSKELYHYQLYNLKKDTIESTNLYLEQTELANKLLKELQEQK